MGAFEGPVLGRQSTPPMPNVLFKNQVVSDEYFLNILYYHTAPRFTSRSI